jgi:hypothetical protein
LKLSDEVMSGARCSRFIVRLGSAGGEYSRDGHIVEKLWKMRLIR